MTIPLDKQTHALAGAVITLALALVLIPLLGLWPGLAAAQMLASLAAALKEWYDYHHPLDHSCEFNDWLATDLGALAGCLWIVAALSARGLI